jgi:hypothetical protein
MDAGHNRPAETEISLQIKLSRCTAAILRRDLDRKVPGLPVIREIWRVSVTRLLVSAEIRIQQIPQRVIAKGGDR